MGAKVYIETHGCQMNVADSDRAVRRLRDAGHEICADAVDADVVLINTCSVRARAEAKLFDRIGHIKQAGGRTPKFGAMGCVAQLEGEKLLRRTKPLDFVVGTRATDRIPELIERVLRGEKAVIDLEERRNGEGWDLNPGDQRSPYTAFVPIIEGCNKFCSYCIVPFSRGREISRPASEIVKEVEKLHEAGFKEVQLIGQNVNSYRPKVDSGLEGIKGATPFVKLLRAIASIGIPRIKFATSFPRDFHTEIVDVINEHENICDWVHLPVQSGSSDVLRRMRRGYCVEDFMQRVEYLNRSPRNLALTTDIIIGFPGETEADFNLTLELLRRCGFHSVYFFKYSERAGTHAAKLVDDVPHDLKTERFIRAEELQYEVQTRIYDSYVGRRISVLVEGRSARTVNDAVGHSSCNKVVNFHAPQGSEGKIVDVLITAAKSNSLYGERV